MNFRSNETTHLKEDRTLRAVERRIFSKVLIPVRRETWPWVETLEAKIKRIEQAGRTTREE